MLLCSRMFKPFVHEVNVSGIGVVKTGGIRNEREVTEFVYARPPKDSSWSIQQRMEFYIGLLQELKKRNGKYYLRIRRVDIDIFEGVLAASESGVYLENEIRRLRLSIIPLNQKTKERVSGYQFQRESDLSASQVISEFQMKHLAAMRSLSVEVIREKFGARYNDRAIQAKLKERERVAIFTARDEVGKIVATLVATVHFCSTLDRKPQKTIYLSDLMLDASVINKKEFLSCFINYASGAIPQVFSLAKTATFMSPGADEDSLVRCVRMLGEGKSCEPLIPSRERLYPYFVAEAASSAASTQALKSK
ncbi:MAG: hypothetical protein ACD_44C00260G0005 [uncultured bacterium]|nr:MAG: hypothetical protein ACD_44C00260G0005 [uncultured bacterium]